MGQEVKKNQDFCEIKSIKKWWMNSILNIYENQKKIRKCYMLKMIPVLERNENHIIENMKCSEFVKVQENFNKLGSFF